MQELISPVRAGRGQCREALARHVTTRHAALDGSSSWTRASPRRTAARAADRDFTADALPARAAEHLASRRASVDAARPRESEWTCRQAAAAADAREALVADDSREGRFLFGPKVGQLPTLVFPRRRRVLLQAATKAAQPCPGLLPPPRSRSCRRAACSTARSRGRAGRAPQFELLQQASSA